MRQLSPVSPRLALPARIYHTDTCLTTTHVHAMVLRPRKSPTDVLVRNLGALLRQLSPLLVQHLLDLVLMELHILHEHAPDTDELSFAQCRLVVICSE